MVFLVGTEPGAVRPVAGRAPPALAHLTLQRVGDVAGEGEVERVRVVVHLDQLVQDPPLEPHESFAGEAGAESGIPAYLLLKIAPYMMSTSEGEGGHGKADGVSEVA